MRYSKDTSYIYIYIYISTYYNFFLYKWLYYDNFTCVRNICSVGQVFWYLYNTTKIPFILISMEIFSHFCNVFIQCYKIVILHFYYHTFNIVLGGILYQKLFKKLQRTIFLRHSSKLTCFEPNVLKWVMKKKNH
jgi:hypothetical protein